MSTAASPTTRARISITIRRDLVAAAEAAVARGEARSVSAYVESAVAGRAEAESLAEVFAEIYASTGGEPTEEERACARRELGL